MKRRVLLLLTASAGLAASTGSTLLDLELRSTGVLLNADDLGVLLARGFKEKSIANRVSVNARKIADDAVNEGLAKSRAKLVPPRKGDTRHSQSSTITDSAPSRGSSLNGASDLLESYLTQHRSAAPVSSSIKQHTTESRAPHGVAGESSQRLTPAGAPSGQPVKPDRSKADLATPAGGPSKRLQTQPSWKPSGPTIKKSGTRQPETPPSRRGMSNRTPYKMAPGQPSIRAEYERLMVSDRLGKLLQVPSGPDYIPQHGTSTRTDFGRNYAGSSQAHLYTAGNVRAHTVVGHAESSGADDAMAVNPPRRGYTPTQMLAHSPQQLSIPYNALSLRTPLPPPSLWPATRAQQVAIDPANTQRLLSVIQGASRRNALQHEARHAEQSLSRMGWAGHWIPQESPVDADSDSMDARQGFPNLLDARRPHVTKDGDYSTGPNPRIIPRHLLDKRDLDGTAQQQYSYLSPLSTRTPMKKGPKTDTAALNHSPPGDRQNGIYFSPTSKKQQQQADKASSIKRVPRGGPSGQPARPPLGLEERLRMVGGPSRVSGEQFINSNKDGHSSVGSSPSLSSSRYSSSNSMMSEASRYTSTPHPLLKSLPSRIDGSVSP